MTYTVGERQIKKQPNDNDDNDVDDDDEEDGYDDGLDRLATETFASSK